MQTVETLNEGLRRAYTLTIAASDIDAKVGSALKKIAPQIRMPGFRPGKVPANLVRKMHGPQIQQEALQEAVGEGVQALMTENKLRPAMQPTVELGDYTHGQDAEVKITLEVLPEVPAPAIDALKLERLTVPAIDPEIDAQIAKIAAQQKAFEPALDGHPAVEGDQVVMDYVGTVDGVAFDGGTGEGMAIELGSGRLIPGFEDQLEGVKVGEDRVLNVTFPADYPEKSLAGKAAQFAVKVTEVKVPKEAGAPDDEFAKSLGLQDLDQLKGLIRGQVEQELNGLTRTHMKRKLLDQLAGSHDFEVPPSMVEAEFEQIWRQLEHEAGHEEDPAAAMAELESEKDDYRKIAERRVRLGLLLSEIGQTAGVTVSDAEMNRLVAQAAQQYAPEQRQRFAEYVAQEPMAAAQLRAPLYEDKVVDFLFSKAEITEREVTREQLEAEIEADAEEIGGGHVHGPDCDHDHDHDAKPKAKKAKPAADTAADTTDAAAEPAPAPKKRAAKKPAAEDAPAADAAGDAENAPKPKAKRAAKPKAAGE